MDDALTLTGELVATFKLPIPLVSMSAINATLTPIYGSDLRFQQQGQFILITRPEKPKRQKDPPTVGDIGNRTIFENHQANLRAHHPDLFEEEAGGVADATPTPGV